MALDKKVSSSEASRQSSVQTLTHCCLWLAVRILGTNLAVTWCMPNSSIRTCWQVPLPISTSSAISWMVWHRSWWTSSWIHATVSGVVQLLVLRVFVIVNWCATGLEPGMPLKHLRTTQALVPEGLLNHCESLCSTFPKIGTKFDAHLLFLSLIHCENRHRSRTRLQTNACENCPRSPSYVRLGTLTH